MLPTHSIMFEHTNSPSPSATPDSSFSSSASFYDVDMPSLSAHPSYDSQNSIASDDSNNAVDSAYFNPPNLSGSFC